MTLRNLFCRTLGWWQVAPCNRPSVQVIDLKFHNPNASFLVFLVISKLTIKEIQ